MLRLMTLWNFHLNIKSEAMFANDFQIANLYYK